jgi:hypothetical protein
MNQKAAFPYEFTSTLADVSLETLIKWLEVNKAPESILALANNAVILTRMAEHSREDDTLTHEENDSLVDLAQETTWAIVEAGGTFQGNESVTIPREVVQVS